MKSAWRTALLTAWFATLAIAAVYAPPEPLQLWPTLMVQWLLFVFVWWSDPPLVRSLVQRESLLRDLLLGVAAFGALVLLARAFPQQPPQRVPIALALTAGLGEEVVFRGYLQRQYFHYLRWGAIPLQAILFGAVHPGARIEAGVFGLLLGLLAWRARSVRPGIVAHVLLDLLSALGY